MNLLTDKNRLCLSLFEGLIAFLIIFTPLFYGCLSPLPLAIVEMILLSLFIVFLLYLAFDSQAVITYPTSISFLLIFLIISVFQCIPLPKSLLTIISAKTAYLYQQYDPFWSDKNMHTLSVYPLATKMGIVKLLSLCGMFLVTFNMVQKRSQIERLLTVIFVWAGILSLYGIMRRHFGYASERRMFSTFGNRNNYATYMVMIAPLCVGYVLACSNKYKKLLFSFLAAIITASIFISFSRAGVISLIVAFCFFSVWLVMERGRSKKQAASAIVLIVIFVAVLLFLVNLEPLKERFIQSRDDITERLLLYRDSLGIVKDFPLFGVGLDNFRYIFTSYRTFRTGYVYSYLHNDNLQLIVEAGMLGSSLFFLFIVFIFKDTLQKIKARHDPFIKYIAIGGLSGLAGTLFHGLFDFGFHIPAVSFLFWLLLGLLCKSAHIVSAQR